MRSSLDRFAGLSPHKYELLRRRLQATRAEVAPEPRGSGALAPMSYSQHRLWFIDQFGPGNTAYSIVEGIRLHSPAEDPTRIDVLHDCLRELVRRHDVLRTTFTVVDGQPVQRVADELDPPFTVVDLRHLDEAAREAEAVRIATVEVETPFDLERGPLVRVQVLRLRDHELVFVLAIHHIVFDGWSLDVMVREMAQLYEAFAAGAPSPLAPLALQYADYSRWQRERLSGVFLDEQLRYWRQQLGDDLPVLELPLDRPRRALRQRRGAHVSFGLPVPLSAALTVFARRHNVTMFMLFLAAYQVLLFRYSGQRRVPVGIPIAGRTHQELEQLLGFFVNTLVLCGDLDGDPTFLEYLGRVRESALSAYAHQEMPFEKLVEELKPARRMSTTPLFQVMFNLRNPTLAGGGDLDGVHRGNGVHARRRTVQVDLSLGLEDKNGWCGSFEYDTDLFEAATIERLIGQFESLLASAVEDPEQRISALSLVADGAEAEPVLRGADERLPQLGAHQLVATQAQLTPDAIAVVDARRSVSYGELGRRAGRLARQLRGLGVGCDAVVGVCLERSSELVVALLAVLEAGGAYLVLDPAALDDRLRARVDEAQIRVVVTDAAQASRLGQVTTVIIEPNDAAARSLDADLPAPAFAPGSLAYVACAEGVEGPGEATRVHGAMIEHHSLINRVAWHARTYDVLPSDRAAVLAGGSLEASVHEIWPYLASGASLHVVPEAALGSTRSLIEWLDAREITVGHLATSLAEDVLTQPGAIPATLRALFTSGDVLKAPPRRGLPFAVHHHYGPVEAGALATSCEIQPDDVSPRPPIGRPIDNVEIHLLDTQGRPVPAGTAGELYIGGEGLARGYLHDAGATEQRFVANRFGPGRLYRTGDLARVRADGNLLLLGRTDRAARSSGPELATGNDGADDGRGRDAVAPRDHVEHRLARLWEEILGRRPVGALDNFFELGGHSFHAVALMRAIEKEFGRRLPVATLFADQTLEALAVHLHREPSRHAPSCLVPIQERGDRRPLICVHPVGGNVFCYTALARALGADQPLHALQAFGLDAGAPPDEDIPAMAARYVDAVRGLGTRGRHRLAGWSFGGVVAYEMARQLEAAGEDVEGVFLFDSFAGWGRRENDPTEVRLVRWFLDDLVAGRAGVVPSEAELARITGIEAQLQRGVDCAREAHAVPLHTGLDAVLRLFHVFQANLRALRTFEPGRISAPVTLFQAAAGAGANHQADPDNGWRRVDARLTVRPVPGDHYTLLQPPHVQRLAERLTAALNAPTGARGDHPAVLTPVDSFSRQ